MNWGKGLILTMALFAALMAWLVVRSSQSPEPLVTEQYYEQELHYQDRIDALTRANALTAPVSVRVEGHDVRVVFPPEQHGKPITGNLQLLRPNDPTGDRALALVADAQGVFASDALHLRPGRFNLALDWTVEGVTYRSEQRLDVP